MLNKDDVMLIDVQYVRKNKRENLPDYLYIIYKIISTGEKKLLKIPEPEVSIYFEKPEHRNFDYIKQFEWMDRLDEVKIKYTDIIPSIVNDIGSKGKERLAHIYETGNYKELKEFLKYPYVFGADMDIRTLYRHKWYQSFDNKSDKTLTKGFLDIEVDIMEGSGSPDPTVNPIDLVTLIDGTNKVSYTFALVGVQYKEKLIQPKVSSNGITEEEKRQMYESRIRQQEYLMDHVDELKEELHDLFDESYGYFDYKFYFYHDERQMLVHLFQLINKLKLDLLGIWNISFDMPYIKERGEYLGLDPKEFMCHPDFPNKECYFKKDKINFAVKNKADFFHISSYTVFLDQMILYAAIRKGRSELRSNKLTYIAEKEIGDEKLDYSEDGNIKTLSYKNYKKYFIYNIKDVLLQYGIESKVNDYDTFWFTAYQNITPYESIFKQTVKLRCVQYKSFYNQGIIPGSNKNSGYAKEEEIIDEEDDEDSDSDKKYEGALVGNPLLNGHTGMVIFNKKSNNVFQYSIDMDMRSFYPWTIITLNINETTLIFKVVVPSDIYDSKGGKIPYHGITDVQLVPDNSDSFDGDVGKEVFDNLQTGNYLSTAIKWLNAPTVLDIYNRIKEKRKDH